MDRFNSNLSNRFISIKIPFSSYLTIDHFLNKPIFSHTVQQKYTFAKSHDSERTDHKIVQFHTRASYQEQPYCRLACSNVHTIMKLINEPTNTHGKTKNALLELTDASINNPKPAEIVDTSSHYCPSSMSPKMKVPVVLGEYTVGLCLEESTLFEKGLMSIQDVSKEIILTDCTFLPTRFTPTLDETKQLVSKGILFVEGYIHEGIEYIPAINREMKRPREWVKEINYQIDQKLVLDLTIQLLQLQEINA